MQTSIENHLKVLAFLREKGPKSAVEIRDTFEMHPNTLYDLLDRIVRTKWAFIIKEGPYKGKYAFYWYDDLEWKIEQVLKKKYVHVIKHGWVNVHMQHFVALTLKVPDTAAFKRAYDKVLEHLNIEVKI